MPGYEIVDFDRVGGVECPCGTAHRAFAETADFPCTLHRTHITRDAKLHHHRRQTEVYYILACDDGAQMQLDDEFVAVRPGTAILIRPGTRHRAIGEMTVLIVVWPKFDPEDEWIDE
jgi:mannose-6-phosphate isomerase-like protein (cupin superfamily)